MVKILKETNQTRKRGVYNSGVRLKFCSGGQGRVKEENEVGEPSSMLYGGRAFLAVRQE